MKDARKCKVRKALRFSRGLNSEAGYVLTWVIIVMVVAGLVMAPFLSFMMTGLTSAQSYSQSMHEFYAADSGIEDAIYKIQSNYLATTTLTGNINSNAETIPVESTALFPPRGVIRVEAELIYYEGKNETEFTDCERGYDLSEAQTSDSDSHSNGTEVTAGLPADSYDTWKYGIEDMNNRRVDVTIEKQWVLHGLEDEGNGTMPHADLVIVGRVVDIKDTYGVYSIETTTETPGSFKIDRIGAWLPGGFEYVPGSASLGTKLTQTILAGANNIPVESVKYFMLTDHPDGRYGVAAIDAEIIKFTGVRTGGNPALTGCLRGEYGTVAADHTQFLPSGERRPVSIEPEQSSHNGGTALFWDLPNIDYIDLPAPPTGGFQQGDEFPIKKGVTFNFTPGEYPMGIFTWVRTIRHDIFLSWDITSGSYKVTSVATDPSTGTHTSVYSFTNRDRQYGIPPLVGDAKVIGNSFIRDKSEPADGIREKLYDSTGAEIPALPDGARVEAAYLYWSGWKSSPLYDPIQPTDTTQEKKQKANDIEDLAALVDSATFSIDTGSAWNLQADRVQFLQNGTGWSFSAFKDVTSLLTPPQSSLVAFSPPGSEEVRITNIDSKTPTAIITASGANPGSITLQYLLGDTLVTAPPILPDGSATISVPLWATLSAGSPGAYSADIRIGEWNPNYSIEVDKPDGAVVYLGKAPPDHESDGEVTPVSFTMSNTPPEMTVQNISGGSAEVVITATGIPTGGSISVTGGMVTQGDRTLDGVGDSVTLAFALGGAATLTGSSLETYEVNVECPVGVIGVVTNYEPPYDPAEDAPSLILGEPGSQITSGTVTLSNVEAYTVSLSPDGSDPDTLSDDLNNGWSYGGWSLILIYSDPTAAVDTDARYFVVHDTFLGAGGSYPSHTFTDKGFNSPVGDGSWLAAFVGEGDEGQIGDYIEFNGARVSDSTNPLDNVFNGRSLIGAAQITDIDIDAFPVYPAEGTSLATVKLGTTSDSWNLVFLLLALRTDQLREHGTYPTNVTIYILEGE